MKKFLFVLFSIFSINYCYTQIPQNTLFLVVKESNNLVSKDYKSDVNLRYEYWNENKNWFLIMNHINKKDLARNHFKYLLPKEMIKELTSRGNIITSDEFEEMLMPLNIGQAEDLIRLRYPRYYYEYVDDNVYKKNLRYGIFLIFESDLDNDYIECSEVGLIFDRIEQH